MQMTRINHSPYHSFTEVKYKPLFRLVPAVHDHVWEEINDPENWAVKNRLLRKGSGRENHPVFFITKAETPLSGLRKLLPANLANRIYT